MRARILVPILILAFATPLFAAGAADRMIKRGDRFFDKRGKGRQYCVKGIEFYEKALAVDTKSIEASWKLARASYWLGVHTQKEEEKLAIYKKGIEIAKRAISLNKKSVESHFWLGVSYGKYGETKGVMNSLALVDPIKKEMKTVLELDAKFEGGGAHRVLGRLYFKLPGIAGGDNAKAIDHLKKAVAIDGTRLLSHLFLAEVYIAEDEMTSAKKHLKLIIEAPFEKERQPENVEEKAQAKKMLEDLK